MAFFNRVGSILKQSVNKHTNLELSASNASLFQAIRSMSSSKLFVGGLSYGTDESSLREAFSQYGEVIEARVILDRDTGRSRGFGFISFPSSEEATSAMQAMDGQDLHGRQIRVNYATEKRRVGFGGGYGGGGDFNYGGEGGNYAGGGGYASGNYGGGGGGYGNSSGFNYGGQGGNYAGSGGYPANNYDGGLSGGNSSAGGHGSYGGGGNYGNDNNYPVDGGNAGGGMGYGSGDYGSTPNNNYPTQGSSFSSGNGDGFSNAGYGGSSGASYNADQGTQSVDEDLSQEISEGNYRDGDDEPKDYANTRG